MSELRTNIIFGELESAFLSSFGLFRLVVWGTAAA